MLPHFRLAHSRPPAPGKVGLWLAVDQPPMRAADVGFVEDRQAGLDEQTPAPVKPFGVDQRPPVRLKIFDVTREAVIHMSV